MDVEQTGERVREQTGVRFAEGASIESPVNSRGLGDRVVARGAATAPINNKKRRRPDEENPAPGFLTPTLKRRSEGGNNYINNSATTVSMTEGDSYMTADEESIDDFSRVENVSTSNIPERPPPIGPGPAEERENTDKRFVQIEADLSNLNNKIESNAQSISAVTIQMDQYSEVNTKHENIINLFVARTEAIEAGQKLFEDTINHQNSKIQTVSQRVEDITTRLVPLDSFATQSQNLLDEQSRTIRGVQSEISQIQSFVGQSQNNMQGLKDKVSQVDSKQSVVEEKQEDMENKIESLRQELERHGVTVQESRNSQSSQDQFEQLSSRLEQHHIRLSETEERIGQLAQDLAENSERFTSSQSASQTADEQRYGAYQQQITSLQERQNSTEEMVARMQEANTKRVHEISELSQSIRSVQQDFDQKISNLGVDLDQAVKLIVAESREAVEAKIESSSKQTHEDRTRIESISKELETVVTEQQTIRKQLAEEAKNPKTSGTVQTQFNNLLTEVQNLRDAHESSSTHVQGLSDAIKNNKGETQKKFEEVYEILGDSAKGLEVVTQKIDDFGRLIEAYNTGIEDKIKESTGMKIIEIDGKVEDALVQTSENNNMLRTELEQINKRIGGIQEHVNVQAEGASAQEKTVLGYITQINQKLVDLDGGLNNSLSQMAQDYDSRLKKTDERIKKLGDSSAVESKMGEQIAKVEERVQAKISNLSERSKENTDRIAAVEQNLEASQKEDHHAAEIKNILQQVKALKDKHAGVEGQLKSTHERLEGVVSQGTEITQIQDIVRSSVNQVTQVREGLRSLDAKIDEENKGMKEEMKDSIADLHKENKRLVDLVATLVETNKDMQAEFRKDQGEKEKEVRKMVNALLKKEMEQSIKEVESAAQEVARLRTELATEKAAKKEKRKRKQAELQKQRQEEDEKRMNQFNKMRTEIEASVRAMIQEEMRNGNTEGSTTSGSQRSQTNSQKSSQNDAAVQSGAVCTKQSVVAPRNDQKKRKREEEQKEEREKEREKERLKEKEREEKEHEKERIKQEKEKQKQAEKEEKEKEKAREERKEREKEKHKEKEKDKDKEEEKDKEKDEDKMQEDKDKNAKPNNKRERPQKETAKDKAKEDKHNPQKKHKPTTTTEKETKSKAKTGTDAKTNSNLPGNTKKLLYFSGLKGTDGETVQEFKDRLTRQANELGAEVWQKAEFIGRITHVITPAGTITMKSLAAALSGKWTVSPDWVFESFKEKKWLKEEDFGMKSSKSKGFEGVSFYKARSYLDELVGTGPASENVKNMEKLVKLGKGAWVNNPDDANYILTGENPAEDEVSSENAVKAINWNGFVTLIPERSKDARGEQ
eukprot:TRINITY_DN2331_c1_g1_i1.p1 TRINITY_DN2331_c1_g1~~TRINITY_DN2331_c1_g1_i1.p1  ORF type:complete len:1466 (+),score=482.00 TRINITY_DN2331_c1_g1_i1:370-4398(+)